MLSGVLVWSGTHAGLCCSFVCLVIDCLWLKLADILYVPMLSIVPPAWSGSLGRETDKGGEGDGLASSLRDSGADKRRAGEGI